MMAAAPAAAAGAVVVGPGRGDPIMSSCWLIVRGLLLLSAMSTSTCVFERVRRMAWGAGHQSNSKGVCSYAK